MGVGGRHDAPAALPPRKRPGTNCTGGRVEPRAGLEAYGKSRPTSGFDPRTVQPVAYRYTDYAIPSHRTNIKMALLISVIHRISRSNGYHICFVYSEGLHFKLRPETGSPEILGGFLQFLQENSRIVPQIRPQSLSFISFPVYYSASALIHDAASL